MMDKNHYLIVLTTFSEESSAQSFARQLVDQSLCSCVHLHPKGLSIYRWQGSMHESQEIQAVIKCTQDQYPLIEQYIQDHHPYDLPECIAISLHACSATYGQWLRENARTEYI